MDSTIRLFGQRVRSLRIEHGFTLEDLEEATGLGVEMLKKIERGASSTSWSGMIALAHAFQLDPIFLFTFPGVNPIHDTIEVMRDAPKATVNAIAAAATGLAAGLAKPRRRAAGEHTS
jgi:transcriptional regulator with XRE-family HTH domain